MKRGAIAVGLSGIFLAVLGATPAFGSGAVAGAARVGAAPASLPLALVLPLQANYGGLSSWATAVATPGSRYYHEYQSVEQLARRFGAGAARIHRVLTYLNRIGARDVKVDATGLFVDATLDAGTAQRVFGTPLSRYHSARDGSFVAPDAAARIPAELGGLVTAVVGLSTRSLIAPAPSPHARFARPGARIASQPPSGYAGPPGGTRTGCGGGLGTDGFTPNQYRTAYGFSPLISAGATGQGETVALIEIDGFRYSDVQTFARCFRLDIPAVNVYGVGRGVPSHGLPPGAESTLDFEVLDAVAPDLKEIDDYETAPTPANVMTAMTAAEQNPHHRPQIISASLGICEPFLAQQISRAAFNAGEAALQLMGATGISVMAASGDHGSAACVSNSGQPVHHAAVSYPASSPSVTGVGGTNLFLNNNNTIQGQVVWNDTNVVPGAGGGGGFSDLFHRPGYQAGVVGANARGVPDISGLSDVAPGYAIFCTANECLRGGTPAWQTVGGTSAATPLFAGGFALVDEYLRAKHKADLGFANPLLYKLAKSSLGSQVFSDVKVINNDVGPFIGGGSLGCCSARAGYDEASGWGSPDLTNLALAAAPLEPAAISLSLPGGQHPVRRHAILVSVSCQGPCRLSAFGAVKIGNAKPFDVFGSVYTLHGAGHKLVALSFTRGQLNALRSALRQHKSIAAVVAGVEFDSHGNISEQTPFAELRIRS